MANWYCMSTVHLYAREDPEELDRVLNAGCLGAAHRHWRVYCFHTTLVADLVIKNYIANNQSKYSVLRVVHNDAGTSIASWSSGWHWNRLDFYSSIALPVLASVQPVFSVGCFQVVLHHLVCLSTTWIIKPHTSWCLHGNSYSKQHKFWSLPTHACISSTTATVATSWDTTIYKFAAAGKQSNNSNSNSAARDLFVYTRAVAKQAM